MTLDLAVIPWMTPIAQATKLKINRTSLKWKTFVLQKTRSRMWKDNPQNERKFRGLGNIFVSHISNEGLESIIHKKLLLNNKKTTHFTVWAEDPSSYFSKEDIQVANKYMKRCLTSLAVREMRIQTTVRCHFTPIRTFIIKKTDNKCWQGQGEVRTLLPCWSTY